MSTLKVTNIENPSTTSGGIDINTSGHVTVDGLAMPSAGALSNRNLIINGAMQVAQRGTSSTGSGYKTVDRFKVSWGSISITQSQQALSSGDPYDEGFRYFLRAANTSTSSATGSYSEIHYYTESQDIAKSGWNYTDPNSFATVSFWVRSSLAGTYYVHCADEDVSALVYNIPFTLSADTWTKVTHSIPGNSSLVFNNDTGRGLRLSFLLHYGTNYTHPSSSQEEAWFTRNSGNYTPDYSQNWNNTASATFDVTGFQLEVGEVATPFEHRSYGDELARCQRYYFRSKSSASSGYLSNFGSVVDSSRARFATTLPVEMRADPTIDHSNVGVDKHTATYSITDLTVFTAPAKNVIGVQSSGSSGMTGGDPCVLYSRSTNTGYIEYIAEL